METWDISKLITLYLSISIQAASFASIYLHNFSPVVEDSYSLCLELTRRVIDDGEMDEKYKRVTLSMDGTHRLSQVRNEHGATRDKSYW